MYRAPVEERTCDVCAAKGRCSLVGDAYICEECQKDHDAAIDFATAEVLRIGSMPLHQMHRDRVRKMVGIVIRAYNEYEPAWRRGRTNRD